MAIHLNRTYLKGFMADHELGALFGAVKAAHESLHNHTGLGNDFLGWVELPTNYDREEFSRGHPGRHRHRRLLLRRPCCHRASEIAPLQQPEKGYPRHLFCRKQREPLLSAGAALHL